MVVRSFEPRYVPPPPGGHRRGWLVGFAACVAVLIAGLGVLVAVWSGATLSPDRSALAKVGLQPFAGSLVRATAFGPDGRTIPVAVTGGRITPLQQVTPGEVISVDVVIRRPGWLSWALGSFRDERLTLRAPVAQLRNRWLTISGGKALAVNFDQPVSAVSFAPAGAPAVNVSLPGPTRTVTLPGLGGAGTATVSAAARSWERPSTPVQISWFPRSRSPVLLADPAPGTDVSPLAPIRLSFSVAVSRLFGITPPTVGGAAHGRWRELDSHTLLFTPTGVGEPLGSQLRFTLPRAVALSSASGELSPASDQLAWTVPLGSPLRLEQLLAQQGYLPLDWRPSGAAVARNARAQAAAAIAPPAGSFAWRYPNTPAQLKALWSPGRRNQILKGAVMTFERHHGLGVDGIAGPLVWHALLTDAVGARRTTTPYSYVYVRVKEPQLLTLWSAGRTVLTSPGNTGIPSRPTAPGTFQVFEHIPVGTMSGTNPDGSHYNDPGIRWISYFNGGDALHAFPRASFGTPQSLGCVELPLPAAAKLWPYTPIGTLVTIE